MKDDIYTFENRCIQNTKFSLGDDTTKIILNTKGTMDDITPEMKRLLNFIDGKEPEDEFTRQLDEAVQSVRKNEKWRLDYMTLQMNYQEKYDTGYDTGYNEGDRKRAISVAMKMIESNKLSSEEIALYSCLTLEQFDYGGSGDYTAEKYEKEEAEPSDEEIRPSSDILQHIPLLPEISSVVLLRDSCGFNTCREYFRKSILPFIPLPEQTLYRKLVAEFAKMVYNKTVTIN